MRVGFCPPPPQRAFTAWTLLSSFVAVCSFPSCTPARPERGRAEKKNLSHKSTDVTRLTSKRQQPPCRHVGAESRTRKVPCVKGDELHRPGRHVLEEEAVGLVVELHPFELRWTAVI